MRFEATVEVIRALLQLAEFDREALDLPLDTYAKRREALRRRVPGALLERYEAVRDGGRRPAVAAVERGACSGCHVRLSVVLDHQARRSTAIFTCQHCRRLIYAPEALGAAGTDVAPATNGPGPHRPWTMCAKRS